MSPDPRCYSWEVSPSNLIFGDTHQPWTLSERGIPPLQDAHDFRDIDTALRFSLRARLEFSLPTPQARALPLPHLQASSQVWIEKGVFG